MHIARCTKAVVTATASYGVSLIKKAGTMPRLFAFFHIICSQSGNRNQTEHHGNDGSSKLVHLESFTKLIIGLARTEVTAEGSYAGIEGLVDN
jgi:hypothetical protein